MHIPVDEILVFAPLTVAAIVYFGREAYLKVKYRHVP